MVLDKLAYRIVLILEACPPGTYRSTDMDTCSECETNYFSGSGAHSCTFCGTGSVSNADNTACGKFQIVKTEARL